MRMTSLLLAPSAIRIPISRVRWLTIKETTPYSPTDANTSVSAAMSPAAPARKRNGAYAYSSESSIARTGAFNRRMNSCRFVPQC